MAVAVRVGVGVGVVVRVGMSVRVGVSVCVTPDVGVAVTRRLARDKYGRKAETRVGGCVGVKVALPIPAKPAVASMRECISSGNDVEAVVVPVNAAL